LAANMSNSFRTNACAIRINSNPNLPGVIQVTMTLKKVRGGL
jgi:hypothetical protein